MSSCVTRFALTRSISDISDRSETTLIGNPGLAATIASSRRLRLAYSGVTTQSPMMRVSGPSCDVAAERRQRTRQALDVGAARLIRPQLQHDLDAISRCPVAVVLQRRRDREIRAESGLETERSTEQDDEILQRAMVLFTDQVLTGLYARLGRHGVHCVVGQKPTKTLPRRVETGAVVQLAHERQHVVERDADRTGTLPGRLHRGGALELVDGRRDGR